MTHAVRVRAHAKINLALRVGAPRPDGYHPLTSVFEAIDLAEDVTAELLPGRDAVTCAVAADSPRGAGLDVGPDNLLVRAALAVAQAARRPEHGGRDVLAERGGIHLTVTKHVPVAGGLAGGSADAAAALVACDALWETDLGPGVLHELARGLGADVPFALDGGVALGVDRGDRLTAMPVAPDPRHHWVLAISAEGLSTPAVFRHLDAEFPAPAEPADAEELLAVLVGGAGATVGNGPAGEALDLAPLLVNDLTVPALDLRPDLADTFAAFERAGALAVLLCGSGPTVAALCLDGEHAASVAEVVRAAEVAADVLTASGPVPGARVIAGVPDLPDAQAGAESGSESGTLAGTPGRFRASP